MENKEVEEMNLNSNINLDDSVIESELPLKEVPVSGVTKGKEKNTGRKNINVQETLVNCLRNERILIRHIPKEGSINNPKHVLFGGMAENASRTFVVPKLTSGMFVNVLTDDEKTFLEDIMGLEYNALSIYKKIDNFWDDSNEIGISKVRLYKQDNFLNLSDPEDYIRYKILIANKDFIAPSLQVLQDIPKATYQYVIISEGEETKAAKSNLNIKKECYKEFGKIENDSDTLRLIIELIDGRPTSPTNKLDFLQTKIDNLITADSKLFYTTITDKLLKTKVLLKRAIEAGLISNRDGKLYLRSDNSPLCEHNEEPTLSIAAKYINSPKRQDIKFSLEAKIK